MRIRHLAVLAAFGCPTALFAQDPSFDGVWRANPSTDCTGESGDGSALRIADEVLYGMDSECRMTSPVKVRDMAAILYDMVCLGDDETGSFTERAMFLKAADGGLYLIWNGYAFKYEVCSEDAAVGTVTTSREIGIPD